MRTRRPNAFTLIELLVVIGIIALLAAILIPVIQTVFTNADKFKAKAECQEIRKAVESYYNTYGRLPIDVTKQGTDKTSLETDVLSDTDFQTMIKVLTALPNDTSAKTLNPRNKVFLDVQVVDKQGIMLDPWDKQYKVKLDHNLDGRIDFPKVSSPLTTSARAVVYSFGPNQTDDITKALTDPDNDDVSTVKK